MEGSQALRLRLPTGTPWAGEAHKKGRRHACARMGECPQSRSPGGSVRPQDLQQELRVDLRGVDPPTVQVQQAADRLLLRVQHRHVGGMTPQVQLRLGASRWSGRGDVLPKRSRFGRRAFPKMSLPERKREWQSISCCLVLTQWRKCPCRYTRM